MSGARPMTNSQMLEQQSWAVIGDVLHKTKPARAVCERLEAIGKTVVRVNPRATPASDPDGILFKNLSDAGAKTKVDVIDLIINPRDGLVQMQQAAELGIKAVWIQPGAGSDEIRALCKENDIAVYEGCVLIETPDRPRRLGPAIWCTPLPMVARAGGLLANRLMANVVLTYAEVLSS